ncbi:hypothetical protein [Mesorhizobium muleiense]|uniref:hypothetical protein n=1 Tax=Mesorhizobium muleiense TaxID=1004279 RepID=UPI0014289D2B|nr:hypothetical protein [Mesorhizobium muleiense]
MGIAGSDAQVRVNGLVKFSQRNDQSPGMSDFVAGLPMYDRTKDVAFQGVQ